MRFQMKLDAITNGKWQKSWISIVDIIIIIIIIIT